MKVPKCPSQDLAQVLKPWDKRVKRGESGPAVAAWVPGARVTTGEPLWASHKTEPIVV